MRKVVFFLIVLIFQNVNAQIDSSAELRDKVIDNISDVLFSAHGKEIRTHLRNFNAESDITIRYKVAGQTLDELGGLSEYLLKIYQEINSVNTNPSRTIVGEFSSSNKSQLVRKLQYESKVSPALQNCLFPEPEIIKLDTTINSHLRNQVITTKDYNQCPLHIKDLLIYNNQGYGTIYKTNSEKCGEGGTDASAYNYYVEQSKQQRALLWKDLINNLSRQLIANERIYELQTSDAKGPTPLGLYPHHIISTNNLFESCEELDFESTLSIIRKHTDTHLYFITTSIDYFIPQDSLQYFVDAISDSLFKRRPSRKYIVALWLSSGQDSYPPGSRSLHISQNGNYISEQHLAEIKSKTYIRYKTAAPFVLKRICTVIPKPLILCYQVAKLNGNFTTVYFRKDKLTTDRVSVYAHVFKLDKTIAQVHDLEIALKSISFSNEGGNADANARYLNYYNKLSVLYAESATDVTLEEAPIHFKDYVLADTGFTRRAAMKWLADTYQGIYASEKYMDMYRNYNVQANNIVGNCIPEDNDAVGSTLAIASLLLSPTGLDVIPDALAVVYYSAIGEYENAAENAVGLFIVGNTYAVKHVLKNSAEILTAINSGSKLNKEGAVLKAIDTEQDLMLRNYGITPLEAKLLLPDISANLQTAKKLLPGTELEAKIYSTVRELPVEKRVEFIQTCLKDESFANKCLKDGEEVWKWAGKLSKKKIEYWTSLATKQNNKKKLMLGMFDGGGENSYIAKAGTEYTYFDFGDKWNEIYEVSGKSADEIWKINENFLQNQIKAEKEIWFSHDPYSAKNEQYFAREVNYLIASGVKDFEKIGLLWKAKW